MKKHKLPILLLCCVMLLSLCACSSKSDLPLFGQTEGSTYYNERFGIRCTLDDGWYIYSEEEKAEVAGNTNSLLTDAELEDLVTSGETTVYEFFAQKENATLNIVLAAEKNISLNFLTEEKLIEGMLPQLEEAYLAVGFEDLNIEQSTTQFLGKEHPCILTTCSLNGVPMQQRQVIVLSGSYYICITASTYYENTTDEILSCFTPFSVE